MKEECASSLGLDMSYNPRTNLQEGLEAAWVELPLPKSKPIIIGVCYEPSMQTEFYELLETVKRAMYAWRMNVLSWVI